MATITQQQSYVSVGGSSFRTLMFDPFDIGLGTLLSVQLEVRFDSDTRLSAENLDLAAATLAATTDVSTTLSAWDGRTLVVLASASVQNGANTTLDAFDGTADFSGASGVQSLALTGSASSSGEARNLIYFQGLSSVGIYLADTTTLHVEAGAGLRLLSDANTTVEATVTYNYTPTPVTGVVGSVFEMGFGDTDYTVIAAPSSFDAPTVTGPAQSATFDARPVGWTETATVNRFDPAAGTLRAVNLRLTTSLPATASLENHDIVGNSAVVNQQATTRVMAPGLASALASATAQTSRPSAFLDAFDGTDDFAGPSGTVLSSGAQSASTTLQVTDSASLAAFTGAGTLDLSVQSVGGSRIDGMPELLAELAATAGGTLQISYTYEPSSPVTPIAVANGSTGGSSTPTPVEYTGPVAGILNEFAQITTDNLAISAAIDSWYIRTGDGNDAIQVFGGTNVLDGGRGSNFLVGGAGRDTFFVDAQWVPAPIWNTIENLAPGDAVTIWGIDSFGWSMAWRDGQGAAGHEGLTLHARVPAGAAVSVTLSSYSKADLDSGRLATSYGSADDVPYFHIRAV